MTDTSPEPDTAERLAQIHDRNQYLREIPFDTHGGDAAAPHCPPCELVRGVDDVTWLLEQLGTLEPAGYEYRANGAFIHEVTEDHVSTYPDGWANGYRPERRQLYAGGWQRMDAEQQPKDGAQ